MYHPKPREIVIIEKCPKLLNIYGKELHLTPCCMEQNPQIADRNLTECLGSQSAMFAEDMIFKKIMDVMDNN